MVGVEDTSGGSLADTLERDLAAEVGSKVFAFGPAMVELERERDVCQLEAAGGPLRWNP